jgi:uncharacterized membrane protein
MKLTRFATWLVLVFISLPFVYAAYLYPELANKIPTHFNASGEPDAWGSRNSIFMMPIIMGASSLFVYVLLANIEKIDPKRASGVSNETIKGLGLFTVGSLSFLSLVMTYGIAHNGTPIDKLIFGALGILFAGSGYFMPKLKQNYFAGFKLPWTLENEINWDRTHQLAGKFWRVGGIIQVLFAIAFEGIPLLVAFITIMTIISLIPAIYSYRLFKKGNPPA